MNTASILYLADYTKTPRPHAREGVRIARKWNDMTHRLCDEVLEAELAEHLAAVLFKDAKQADRVRETF